MEHNYKYTEWKDSFFVFWKNLKHLYCKIINFKIIIKVIRLHKREFSYLTVNLRDICSSKIKHCKEYDWDRLEKSIIKYGVVNPLRVSICDSGNSSTRCFDSLENRTCKYRVRNGNHRITILKKVYPPNYKVKIKISNNELKR